MRPQRFVYRHLTGIDLPPSTMLLHRCDIALCVHVDVDPAVSHLRVGGAAENQLDGETYQAWVDWRSNGASRATRCGYRPAVRLSRAQPLQGSRR